MSLDYVKKGEPVRSSTVNSIIDAVAGGGNQSPDFIVTGTRGGPQIVMPSQLGYTQLTSQTIFDLRNYVLSGWPMAKVQMGFSLNDALGAVRVHTDEGTSNAASAVVVFKNQATCPFAGGTLSGYVLKEEDFATDADRGATGWVMTKMEGVYGQSSTPTLQVWGTDQKYIEVIGNANDEDTKNELSTLLQQGGMDGSELSTLKFVDKWTLVEQTTLSGKATARTVFKNGAVDVYVHEGSKPQRAMLKAFLACYDVQETQQGAESDWTWLIPLGDVAAYSDEFEGVYTTQLTYGGDQIFINAENGDLGQNFSGDPTWLEDSEFGGNLLAFGKFHSYGGQIEPGKVWLNLTYDYEKFAVVGTVEENATKGNSVLEPCVLIASADSCKVNDEVRKGDEIPASQVFSGTLGDLFKGVPKLDADTPVQSGSEFKSLQWTKRGDGDDGGPVDCNCMELYGFDSATPSNPVVSTDMYVARRYDSETSSAEIVYLPISEAGVYDYPDSQVSSAQTSSIQWRDVSDKKVVQSWNFDKFDDFHEKRSELSGDAHLFIRNAETSCVEYLALSAIGEGGKGGLPGPFEMELSGNTATFTNCVMRVARAYFFYQDQTCTVPNQDSIVYVILRHSESPSIQVSCGDYATVTQNLGTDWSNMLSTTVTPLYRTLSGEVKCDYRYMMNVQAYDSRNYSYTAL